MPTAPRPEQSHDLPDDADVCAYKWVDALDVTHECRLAPDHETRGGYHACSCGTKAHVDPDRIVRD